MGLKGGEETSGVPARAHTWQRLLSARATTKAASSASAGSTAVSGAPRCARKLRELLASRQVTCEVEG